ncbi:D-arabinono-1,4-lactone oxidase [Mucilaginibacter sabulilitoris]|uniref:D-arabinono-1,4-lactone oxidase n=1 Tax=Mucilaginibacter sabulilitoris TaxID=1173583 RepID=A0ABZ0TV62_9SPHI|nr:D-arabinono-1,4-lactone oxidase [Mucilaginibacter sabulilitoris]WPU97004.1 D-arabinono-1,4-lactone oxidase [Mucilaginibacter sabulilitoris]
MLQTPPLGADGFYHPTTEDEIIALVQKAAGEKLEIRCRGAAHSLARAIYTDPGKGDPQLPNVVSEQAPPKGSNLNVMFDQYAKLVWVDKAAGIIEVEAGIHLGYDPEDPTMTSTLENSLLYQAFINGFTLSDLGGISHQTISGFLMTGSSGGSLMYSIDENIMGLSVIDGNGDLQWFNKGDDDFGAVVLSLGLLGIVSKVKLQLAPLFNIYGQQITYPTQPAACPIDLFGSGSPGKPSFEDFLKATPYTRVLWWPQEKVERVVIWEASRGTAMPVFDPAPYEEFEKNSLASNIEQLLASMLFTMLGNSKFWVVWQKLKPSFTEFRRLTEQSWGGGFFARVIAWLLTGVLKVIGFILVFFFMTFKGLLHALYPFVINTLQPLTKKGNAQLFMDYTYSSLPMDNGANDILMGTEFTEIWIPLSDTEKAMKLLDKMFKEGKFAATGYYSTELYAGKQSNYWMSPAYQQDVLRIDFFWFSTNEGNPAAKDGFFSQFWEALKNENIDFRLHWAKFLPEYDFPGWASYISKSYPRWNDFMALREKRDPNNIFLTDYWSRHLFGKEKDGLKSAMDTLAEVKTV